ncbi:MAG: hypothetical protein QXV97_02015 [Candidatus Caldarchaeum sp.]
MFENELVTASQLAKQLKTTPAKIRKALEELKIKPKTVKCGCSYYDPSVKEKLKKALKT